MAKFQHKNDHHTIPRCYLKNFSDDGKFIYRKLKEKNDYGKENLDLKKPISLKSATVKDNFYTIKKSPEPMVIETVFYDFEVENHYEKLYKKLIGNDSEIIITMEERTRLLMFFLSLHCRTPKQFELFFKNIPKELEHETELIKEEYKAGHIGKTLIEFTKKHEYKVFKIVKLSDGSEFLTSDNPFLIVNEFGHLKNMDFREQFNEENKFLIPIDNKHCLIMTNGNDKNGIPISGKVFYNKIERIDVDCNFAQNINFLTLESAEKLIFGSEKYIKAFFSFIKLN
ncbi:DUF4238 domain-containing protein [Flavobacterium sp. J49]|uniref:DUF4238 domain-containing protein n=1 Tax=Flavobacterium sp. J49 TaxID=2718534 RepID=UPI0015940FEA|nr:DUF4238 domain-containing protein [Flavobacterium sp. J49]MBF6640310.1 DUF4238 domain-containing protein [Flavobacterium sp. J49]NIC01555.1 DUF4238 domain-containing protein [Flavobacterium sp. J49]